MANLKQGSSGSDVKKMQQALIDAGYNVGSTGADGVFGNNTLAAVKQYQKDNNLAVDGIAGKNTLGSLYGSASNSGGNAGSQKPAATGSNGAGAGTSNNTFTTQAGNTYDTFTPEEVTYDPFQGSDTMNQAWATLGQLQGNAPGAWTDPYKDQYMGYLNQYENRDPFSYDANSDALYQQLKDQYIQQGQMAMMDTMGQAAAMTGGYGNSYAQTVGQQAYNQQLNQLTAMIPELYDRAYGIYQDEGQDLLNMYNAYLGLSDQSYNQYLGEVDNYYKQLGAASDYANTLYNKEYGEWADKTGMDIDIANNKNNIGLDTWATQLGIVSGENQMLMNQKFQSEEAQKDRDFQSSENSKSRAAAAAKIVDNTPKYEKFDSEEQDKWSKKFDKALATGDVGAIDNVADDMEAAGIDPYYVGMWRDRYAAQIISSVVTPDPVLQGQLVAPHKFGSLGRYTY